MPKHKGGLRRWKSRKSDIIDKKRANIALDIAALSVKGKGGALTPQ